MCRTPVKVQRALNYLMLCAVLSAGSFAVANPAVYPHRVINYYQVDLMPLVVWWDNQKGERPLSSWKHVQGFLERETIYGWLVRGSIEGQPGLQYFLLKNPPRDELAKYHELSALLPQLEQQRAAHLDVTKLPEYQGWNWDANGEVARMPTDNFDRIQKAKADLREVDAQIATVREDIAKMLDKRGYFAVDAFALQMNELYQGSPVFDFGFPSYSVQ